MKERQILFKCDMVNAILDGRKTQTRRVMKLSTKCSCAHGAITFSDCVAAYLYHEIGVGGETVTCPYGIPGDRLWVRETWFKSGDDYTYRADCTSIARQIIEQGSGWKPSIFMPKEAARIWLEITGIRVERIQDITLADCRAEGVLQENYPAKTDRDAQIHGDFIKLWDSINAEHSWESNPWVWVIEFRRINNGK